MPDVCVYDDNNESSVKRCVCPPISRGGGKWRHKKDNNMKKMRQGTRRSGQSLVEYGLVLALIAIVAILVVKAVGTKTASTFDNIQSRCRRKTWPPSRQRQSVRNSERQTE